jgi:hypothetical protein
MPHLTPPQGRRRGERRPPLWLLLRPQPTTHRLQHQHPLPPPPQRRARRPARTRSPPSPSTFGRLQCGCRRPIYQCIAMWRLPTSKNGLPAMLRRLQATSPTSPRPIVNGTRKGHPARARLCIPTEFRRNPSEVGQKAPARTEWSRNRHRNVL